LAGPGWDYNVGPTDIILNKMYRQRLLDPKLPQELKSRMDLLTTYRRRMLSAVNLVHETTFLGGIQEAVFEINLNVKNLSICFENVSSNYFKSLKLGSYTISFLLESN
jgi:hypothetical protein